MRVKMLSTAAGPEGVYRAGEVIDLPEAKAKVFVAHGYAMALDAPVIEAATFEPAEKAVLPAVKKRR